MKYLYFLLLVSISFQGMAQTELENKIAQLQGQLNEQTERNAILKQALDLREKGSELKQDDVSIRVTSLQQDLENGEISVQGLITYHGVDKRNLQFVRQQLVDPEGNTYETYKVVKPKDESKKIFLQNVVAETPYAFLIKFEGIKEKIATLNLLRMQIYGQHSNIINFDFKGIEVSW